MTFSVVQGLMTAQALIKGSGQKIAVDGQWGPASSKAFLSMTPDERMRLVDVVRRVNEESSSLVNVSATTPMSDFDLVVQAVSREAKRRGIENSVFYIAQIALETGWGRHTPRSSTGVRSWNYAGLKSNSVSGQSSGSVKSITSEVFDGVRETLQDSFAVFSGPEHFAQVYFWYLYDGPSAYRYKGADKARTAHEFGTILQQNGYATDPQYASKIAAMVNSVRRRYANLA